MNAPIVAANLFVNLLLANLINLLIRFPNNNFSVIDFFDRNLF